MAETTTKDQSKKTEKTTRHQLRRVVDLVDSGDKMPKMLVELLLADPWLLLGNELEAAYHLMDDDIKAQFYVADAYAKLGNVDVVREIFEKSLNTKSCYEICYRVKIHLCLAEASRDEKDFADCRQRIKTMEHADWRTRYQVALAKITKDKKDIATARRMVAQISYANEQANYYMALAESTKEEKDIDSARNVILEEGLHSYTTGNWARLFKLSKNSEDLERLRREANSEPMCPDPDGRDYFRAEWKVILAKATKDPKDIKAARGAMSPFCINNKAWREKLYYYLFPVYIDIEDFKEARRIVTEEIESFEGKAEIRILLYTALQDKNDLEIAKRLVPKIPNYEGGAHPKVKILTKIFRARNGLDLNIDD